MREHRAPGVRSVMAAGERNAAVPAHMADERKGELVEAPRSGRRRTTGLMHAAARRHGAPGRGRRSALRPRPRRARRHTLPRRRRAPRPRQESNSPSRPYRNGCISPLAPVVSRAAVQCSTVPRQAAASVSPTTPAGRQSSAAAALRWYAPGRVDQRAGGSWLAHLHVRGQWHPRSADRVDAGDQVANDRRGIAPGNRGKAGDSARRHGQVEGEDGRVAPVAGIAAEVEARRRQRLLRRSRSASQSSADSPRASARRARPASLAAPAASHAAAVR